jgi:hypothetical protein
VCDLSWPFWFSWPLELSHLSIVCNIPVKRPESHCLTLGSLLCIECRWPSRGMVAQWGKDLYQPGSDPGLLGSIMEGCFQMRGFL